MDHDALVAGADEPEAFTFTQTLILTCCPSVGIYLYLKFFLGFLVVLISPRTLLSTVFHCSHHSCEVQLKYFFFKQRNVFILV